MPKLLRPIPTLGLVCAFVGGVSLACQSEIESNPRHCYNAQGDQTCAERFGDERPFCASFEDGCGGSLDFGCVAEPPADECYSPCGDGALASEDSSCLGSADEGGDGDGDGDEESEAVCGDGIVEGDEACDDGNDIDDDECSNACEVATCGDGIVQEALGETCDDGNTLDGDDCPAHCMLPGTLIWSRTYDFDQCAGRRGAITPEGNLIVIAECVETGGRVLGFDGDGELLWNRNAVLTSEIRLALGPNDDFVVAGTLHDTQAMVRYYDSNGIYQWNRTLPDPVTQLRGVAVDGGGGIIAMGEGETDRVWRRYSAEGNVDWTEQEPIDNSLLDMQANHAGRFWALWMGPYRLASYTPTGALEWSSGVLGASTPVGDLTIDAADNVYAVGQTSTEWKGFYVSKYNSEGLPVWTALHDEPDMFETGPAIATLPNDGGVLVAGHVQAESESTEKDGLLSWYASGSEHLQDAIFDGDSDDDADVFLDVATSTEGYAVAFGYHESASAGQVLWLVKVAI
ncbi:MAG: DUF4215 domain-containing protein [Enhygromyxa sp.]